MNPNVTAFFDEATYTITYVVEDAATNHCASGPYTSSSSTLAKDSAISRLRFCFWAEFNVVGSFMTEKL